MKKVGVLLSGCGVYDGSEIHEAVLTLWSIDRAGAQAVCLAPEMPQLHVVNHLTGQVMEGEKRQVMVEAARIARGVLENLAAVSTRDIDALILPGGFGAAKNLCNFAMQGSQARVHPEVERLIREMRAAGKPLGFICIAPVIAAKVLGSEGVQVTIGTDPQTAAAVEQCGAVHVSCTVRSFHADPVRKVASTPAYMLGQRISEVAEGIDKMVRQVLAWTE